MSTIIQTFIFGILCFSSALHAAQSLDTARLLTHRWLTWEEVKDGRPPPAAQVIQGNPWYSPKKSESTVQEAPLLSYWYQLPRMNRGIHQLSLGYVTQSYEAWLWPTQDPSRRIRVVVGRPDADYQKQNARMLEKIISFEVLEPQEDWILLVQVSFAGRTVGGLWQPPLVAAGESLQHRYLTTFAIAFACLGFLGFLVFYEGLLHLRRPQDKAHRWIVAIALTIIARILGIERIFCIFDLSPESSLALSLSYHFEYLSMIGVNFALVPYFNAVFPTIKLSRRYLHTFYLLTLLAFSPLLFLPYESFPDISWLPKIAISIGIFTAMYLLVRAVATQQPYARFMGLIAILPLASFFLEMLLSSRGSGERWTHLTATGFAFSLSYLMARGSAYAYDRVEELSHNLQAEVERQTQEIRQQSADELQKAHELLLKSEQLSQLGGLVASVGHEIASPCSSMRLSTLEGFSQLKALQDKIAMIFTGDEESLQVGQLLSEHIAEIERCLSYIKLSESKIADLSDALRRQSRSEVETTANVDIIKLLEECLVLVRGRTKLFTIHLVHDVSPPLTCVRSRIGQVFLNILANAADALNAKRESLRNQKDLSFQGCIEITVKQAQQDRQNWLVVVISDNGDGVPMALREKIFDNYFTTKAAGVGTGIGLALCMSIVREHQGTIHISDDPKLGGARFETWLPIPSPS